MRTAFACLLAFAVHLAVLPTRSPAEVAVPPLTGRVVDQTGVLSHDQRSRLEERLRAFEEAKGAQVAVLVVPTTRPEAIEQFSIRVADAWKLGRAKPDDGAFLLVALQDRAMRIEVGYGLEGALTDLVSKRIIGDIITPHFRQGDIPGGIEAGVDAMLKVIEGEPLPAPERRPVGPGGGGGGSLFNLLPFLLLFVFGGAQVARAIFGRFLGGVLGGGAAGLLGSLLTGSAILGGLLGLVALLIILFGSGMGGGGRGFGRRGGFLGGFPGGLGGGGGGFRGGGFGGFSGGGGGFGGGGASGRW